MLSIKKLLLKILTHMNGILKVHTHVIPSRSWPANQATWLINVPTAAITPPTGYRAIGVIGASSNSGGLLPHPLINAEGTHIWGFVLNRTTSVITSDMTITILCIRKNLF